MCERANICLMESRLLYGEEVKTQECLSQKVGGSREKSTRKKLGKAGGGRRPGSRSQSTSPFPFQLALPPGVCPVRPRGPGEARKRDNACCLQPSRALTWREMPSHA